jgi:hypothetical protein
MLQRLIPGRPQSAILSQSITLFAT